MFCCQCGKEIASDVKFCTYCGAKQQSGEQIEDETTGKLEKAKFCEIHIKLKRVYGVAYVFVDSMMYKGSRHEIVARVPPTVHTIYVSRYKKNVNDQIKGIGDAAGEIGFSGFLGGIGAIIGLCITLASKLTISLTGGLAGHKDTCIVDCRNREKVFVTVKTNWLKQFVVREEK